MKKALLIIDMVNSYIYGKNPLIPTESRSQMINNIRKAINLAHKKNVPVIYVNSAFKKTDPIFKLYINYYQQAIEETKSAEIIDELKPKSQDFILKKRGYDGFWKSGLQKLLKKLNIKEIYLAGCQTDCGIRETAVTAAHLGYIVYVLGDCCQTNRDFGQVAAFRFFRNCTKGILNVYEFKTLLKT